MSDKIFPVKAGGKKGEFLGIQYSVMCVCSDGVIYVQMELSERVKERERELGELKEAQVLQTKLRHRELESLKQQLEGQLVTMEAQLENRNKEVAVMEGELVSKMAAKESELERVKEERAQLQEQLGRSQALSQQLMAEKHAYQQRMQQMSK